jgi:hypothetical protein
VPVISPEKYTYLNAPNSQLQASACSVDPAIHNLSSILRFRNLMAVNLEYVQRHESASELTDNQTHWELDYDTLAATTASVIRLDTVGLKGSLPQTVPFSTHPTKVFHIPNNAVGGRLPQDMCAWKNLTSLSVESNLLTGPITQLRQLGNLQDLFLSFNAFEGTPEDLATTMSFMHELEYARYEGGSMFDTVAVPIMPYRTPHGIAGSMRVAIDYKTFCGECTANVILVHSGCHARLPCANKAAIDALAARLACHVSEQLVHTWHNPRVRVERVFPWNYNAFNSSSNSSHNETDVGSFVSYSGIVV